MKSNIKLTDGEEMNSQHPDTFPVPSNKAKQEVKKGDLVKIGLNSTTCPGERPFVRVTEAAFPSFSGTVHNELVFAEEYGMDQGDAVSFDARHILDIVSTEHQELEELLGGLVAALDDQATYLVKESIEGLAIIIMHELPVDAPGVPREPFETSFVAAAKKLDLHPEVQPVEENDGKIICFLSMKLSADVSHLEIHKAVRDMVASLRLETQRILAGKGETTFQSLRPLHEIVDLSEDDEDAEIDIAEFKQCDPASIPEDFVLYLRDDDFPDANLIRTGDIVTANVQWDTNPRIWEHTYSLRTYSTAMVNAAKILIAEGQPLSNPELVDEDYLGASWEQAFPVATRPVDILKGIKEMFALIQTKTEDLLP
jgi:hypothetical protein